MEDFFEVLSQCPLFDGIEQSDLNAVIACLDGRRVMTSCVYSCHFHSTLMKNMLQALADYLGVERSAMSAEIGKLKDSGQIDTKGSWFCIKHAGNSASRQ